MKYESVSGEIPPDSIPSIAIVNSNAAATPQRTQNPGSGHGMEPAKADGAPLVSRRCAPAVTRSPPHLVCRATRLPNALQDADIVGDRCTAHVEEPAEPRILDLEIAGRSGELHRGERVHRHASRADRMALGLEPTRRVDRQAPAHLGEAILHRACAAAFRYEAHGFVLDQLGDRETVVRLD